MLQHINKFRDSPTRVSGRTKDESTWYRNIEAHAASAHDLSLMRDGSVVFILANGLLCSMAPQHHDSAVNEMKRILKPNGQAYLSVAKGS